MASISKHIRRVLPQKWEKILDDPRRCERVWSFGDILSGIINGMMSGCNTLRELEAVTEVSGRRIPDTTVRDILVQIDPEPLEEELARGVKEASRNHELDNKELPIKLTVIDGKKISTTSYEVDEYSHNRSNQVCTKYVQLVLRAFHASSTVKLLMGQERIPNTTNESGTFKSFLEKLNKLYGRTNLLEVFSMDAGFTSISNAKAIVDNGFYYIMALKDPRVHKITQETMKLLGSKSIPDKTQKERVNGKEIIRKIYRCAAPDVQGWSHAKEVWRIETQTTKSSGKKTAENRYYVTNLPKKKLSHAQVLKTIRLHWSIENNANWVMDVAWKEDTKPWCNEAIELLSLMRMIAYNTVARFKFRRCLSAKKFSWSWKQTLSFIGSMLFPLRTLPSFATL